MNHQLMHSPLANRFYTADYESRMDVFAATFQRLMEAYGFPENRFFIDGEPPRAFSTAIIEDGRIAYVSASSMLDIQRNRERIFQLFREVSDFEHLIIDMRGNSGGNVNSFLDIMLLPHLREPIYAPVAFYFFLDGPYVSRFGDYLFAPTVGSGFLTITEPYRPAAELLELHDLPEVNREDIEWMHYGAPASRDVRLLARVPWVPAFEGKIWLLTDSMMGSAAQVAAWYSRETGFATLVGDITGGNMGGPRTMALMPNTGILFQFDVFYITDSRGRPLEAGTIPHHFNRPGMDALETVLELIDEGQW